MGIESAPCSEGVEATACFTAEIMNQGDKGDGYCQLQGPEPDGFTPPPVGWEFRLHDVASGATIRTPAVWSGPPQVRYIAYCDPGLRA
jgi:hypothetical protein